MPLIYIVLGYLGFAISLALIGVLIVGKQLKSLPETTTGYIERTDDKIIAAWEEWLKKVPNPDEKILSHGKLQLLSAREFIKAIQDGDKEIRDFAIRTSRTLARELGTDPVEEIVNLGRP